MEPQNTIDNTLKWRIWHCANYVFGAVCFLFGSLLLFPYFATLFNSALISAWLYTVGSLTFTFADLTQWLHYQQKARCKKQAICCIFPNLSLNFFISFVGSFVYFVGSALFIPSVNKLELGLYCFIAGSSCVAFSQGWKVIRVIKDGSRKNKISSTIKQDTDGFLVDLFAGIGGCCYFTGSILFFNPDPIVQLAACTIFSCGGFLFFLSGAFMISRYFLRNSKYQGAISIATTQAKFQSKNQETPSEVTSQQDQIK